MIAVYLTLKLIDWVNEKKFTALPGFNLLLIVTPMCNALLISAPVFCSYLKLQNILSLCKQTVAVMYFVSILNHFFGISNLSFASFFSTFTIASHRARFPVC